MGEELPFLAVKQDGEPPTGVSYLCQTGSRVRSSFDQIKEMQKYRILLHNDLEGMIFTHP